MPTPHSTEWYDRLAGMQRGYYYPWRSTLPPFNGEDVYLDLVRHHLSPETTVLDVACGHGEVALEIAPLCREVVAYDRVPSYIELAQQSTRERGIENVTFICADSSAEANGGRARLPAEADSFDLLISRRGPLHWIEDVPRVARKGAVLLQLNPMNVDVPAWNDELPERLRMPVAAPVAYLDRSAIRMAVERHLTVAGLCLDSCWSFEVPEVVPDALQLYRWRTWGHTSDEVPLFEEVHAALEGIVARHAGPDGLAIPFGRFLWKAVVPCGVP